MVGAFLSHYHITAELGVGGVGEVYRAHDVQLGREVAIKMLPEDGNRLALTLTPSGLATTDIYLYDLARRDHERLTEHLRGDWDPRWSADGARVVFSSLRGGGIDLYERPVDGSAQAKLLFANDLAKTPGSWFSEGRFLAFEQIGSETGDDIWLYDANEPERPKPFLVTRFNENRPSFSPDGRWLAYSSDHGGQYENYVVPFPGPGPRCKVSTGGGSEPRWSRGGDELVYRGLDGTAMIVDVADRDFCRATPRPLFEGLEYGVWDVSPDGELFVTLEPREPPQLRLVQNCFEELKRLAPRED